METLINTLNTTGIECSYPVVREKHMQVKKGIENYFKYTFTLLLYWQRVIVFVDAYKMHTLFAALLR